MAHRTRTRRLLGVIGITALATGAALITVPPQEARARTAAAAFAADSTVTVRPDPSYRHESFQGWGTSLVWFANATGDYPEEIRQKLAGLLFGDDGLALNIARYNIGGGNAPDVKDYLRAGGAVEGWWKAPEGTTREDTDWWSAEDLADWNPRADATQRWWVDRIKKDIDHWETFSNSPPWFMTHSGYVSGGFDSSTDQLKDGSADDFAAYLAGATERLEKAHGIKVGTLDPFNEPNTTYWGTRLGADGQPVGGRQEGAHIGPELQQKVLRALASALERSRTDAKISAMDETNPGIFAQNWNTYPREVRDLVEQMNVHTYGTAGRTSVRDLAKAEDKPLWMSEVEGDWGDGQDFEDMSPGLGLAQHMVDDLRELEPRAWMFWQPVEDYDNMKPGGESARGGNWGSIQLPFSCTPKDTLATCPIRTNTKFDTARNFTHFIKPGDRLIGVDDTSSAATVSGKGDSATVVHVNSTTGARTVTVDLSKFGHLARHATVTPVVTSAAGKLQRHGAVAVSDRKATFTVPAESVTSFVVKGVSGAAKDAALLRKGHTYRLTGVQSGKVLTTAANGTGLVIRTASTDAADPARQWQLRQISGDTGNRQRYVFTNPAEGKRLAVRDGAPLLEADSGPRDKAAQWIMSTTGDGTWTLVNAATGRLLEVGGQATHDGAAVTLWTPNSGANQRWKVSDVTARTTARPE
ncbi:ricin-type beta-trefoil lectin domain protein [Streptomyces agglomeratus]|uniref:Ricin-type beta-trefoil lectin domain protein n=1 Tax=Streptomyces agglomeratus TaxID=285458 RepID=A0A1E5P2X2_9ACTN|nr:RICIN domain-containing protein [Streptomyces agglomeratus]OEJ23859.1 ricin-type beta-trefoil lectin domain protein [Streptomyces agglomeratus]OEJ43457.1 ricin-type beta-trefoil lectin domain protein [Streptomyces agglomeratus]OEJ54624.1 ricin-type beta-trefoil lectin domain protein [Streptomyces agglomeratus]